MTCTHILNKRHGNWTKDQLTRLCNSIELEDNALPSVPVVGQTPHWLSHVPTRSEKGCRVQGLNLHTQGKNVEKRYLKRGRENTSSKPYNTPSTPQYCPGCCAGRNGCWVCLLKTTQRDETQCKPTEKKKQGHCIDDKKNNCRHTCT